MPDVSTAEFGSQQQLRTTLDSYEKEFESFKDSGISVETISTAGAEVSWQVVRYGRELINEDSRLYRGYVMIEPEDLPKVLRLLDQIGRSRLQKGQTTQFKWMLKKDSPEFMTNRDYKIKETGDYELVEPNLPK